jgi:hypothetical protein
MGPRQAQREPDAQRDRRRGVPGREARRGRRQVELRDRWPQAVDDQRRQQEQRRLPGHRHGEEDREPRALAAPGEQQAPHGGQDDDRDGGAEDTAGEGHPVPQRGALGLQCPRERELLAGQRTALQDPCDQEAEAQQERIDQHEGGQHQADQPGEPPGARTGHDADTGFRVAVRPPHRPALLTGISRRRGRGR